MFKLRGVYIIIVYFLSLFFSPGWVQAQAPAAITLEMNKPGVSVSPRLYGLMTEEINYSYDGGLYAEMIRNRSFMEDSAKAAYWSLLLADGGKGTISLDRNQPLNERVPVSLKLIVEDPVERVGIVNKGYWGMGIRPNTIYKGSFYCKTKGQSGTLIAALESSDGTVSFAASEVKVSDTGWMKYHFTLKTSRNIQPTKDARFVLFTRTKGTYWFSMVSLFPPTYHNRDNGNRRDIMQLLADMKPSFLRFPGGNYLEGKSFAMRFNWKKTIGPIEMRSGHESPWGYYSSDGMGLLEFLEWCEDLNMEPLLAVFAGYSLNGVHVSGDSLKPYIQNALDEIQYVIGNVHTKWGAVRARDGHPEPFELHYVEIGNEDMGDPSGSYAERFTQFYKAIKARYPQLKIVSSVSWEDLSALAKKHHIDVAMPDVCDEHYYRNAIEMYTHANQFDHYSRSQPKVLVGEWATREGSPTTDFNAALGDAAWMTGMERNSDQVIMASYAPLFVNVNPGGMQWSSDLIGYNALNSYGSPSYYVQKMFHNYLGDKVIPITASHIPSQEGKNVPALFYVATKDTKSGTVYLKVVNVSGSAQVVQIKLNGSRTVKPRGLSIVLKTDNTRNTNSIKTPRNIVPVKTKVKGLGRHFMYSFPPTSITVLKVETK